MMRVKWVFSTVSGPLAQRAAAGPRAGASFFSNFVAEQLTVSGGVRAGTPRLFDGTGRIAVMNTGAGCKPEL